MKLDRSWVIQKAHQIYPIRSRVYADLPKPPQTVIALEPKLGSVGKHRPCSGQAILRAERSRSRAPGNARRYPEKVPVVQHQFASGGTDGWFGGSDSEYRPSGAISRGERARGPFPAPRMV